MKRLIVAVGLTAFLTGLCHAQDSKQQDDPRDSDPLWVYEKQRKKDREQADIEYQKTLKRTRQDVKAQPLDPWANMRGSGDANASTSTKR